MLPSEILVPERAYDIAARFYDAWSWQRFWREHEYPVVRRFLGTHDGRSGRSVLDLGCGTGQYLRNVAPLFTTAVGIDVSDGMLAVARSYPSKAEFHKADLRSLPFPPSSFDAVISCRVMTHLDDTRPAFAEIARVLKPSGIAVVTNIDADHRYGFTRLPTDDADVFTTTVKHTVGELRLAASAAGLLRTGCFFLDLYGKLHEEDERPSWNEDIVGSIAVFGHVADGLA